MARTRNNSPNKAPRPTASGEFAVISSDSDSEFESAVTNSVQRRRQSLLVLEEDIENEESDTTDAVETVTSDLPQRVMKEPTEIFKYEGRAVKFFLDGKVANERRGEYLKLIRTHGGRVITDREKANTILVPSQQVNATARLFRGSPQVYVEAYEFVNECIRQSRYYHPRKELQAIGGRPRHDGRARMPFTKEDKRHLAKWMAHAAPCEHCGGRGGNELWKGLENEGESRPNMDWVRRHTWQSWRGHYQKRKHEFDPEIRTYVAKFPPPDDNNGRYLYTNGTCRKCFNIVIEESEGEILSDESDTTEDEQEEDEGEKQPAAVVNITSRKRHLLDKDTLDGRSISDRSQKRRRLRGRHEENSATLVEEAREPSAIPSESVALPDPGRSVSIRASIDLPERGDAFTSFHIDELELELANEEDVSNTQDAPLSAWHGVAPVRRPINSQATLVGATQPTSFEKSVEDEDSDDGFIVAVDRHLQDPSTPSVSQKLAAATSRKRRDGSRVLDNDDVQVEEAPATPAREIRSVASARIRSKAPTAPVAVEGRVTRSRSRSVEPRVAAAPSRTRKGNQRHVDPIAEEPEVVAEDDEHLDASNAEDASLNIFDGAQDGEDDEELAVLGELGVDNISNGSQGSTYNHIGDRPSVTQQANVADASRPLSLRKESTPPVATLPPGVMTRRTRGRVLVEIAPPPEVPPKGTRAYEHKRKQEAAKQDEPFAPSPRAQAALQKTRSRTTRTARV